MEDWESSSGEFSDSESNLKDANDEELFYTSGSLAKLQARSNASKARWDSEMGMAEVLEKKGKMWITTGIVRGEKTYCSLEETLFLAEIGALVVVEDNDMSLSLKEMYGKTAEVKSGCSWELFEVYRHLKSLGYIVGRHGVPWTVKGVKRNCESESFHDTPGKNGVMDTELDGSKSIVEMFSNLQVDELKPVFDVYLPNSKFRKSSPGNPIFSLCLIRGGPPPSSKLKALEIQCGEIPMKFCHVEHGRVSIFDFKKVELPVLP